MKKYKISFINFLLSIICIAFINAIFTIDVNAADYSGWMSVFDPQYYMSHNADAAAYANGNVDKLWEYFINKGIPKGDQASDEFNVYIYAKNYPDLYKAYGGQFMKYYVHYAQQGKAQGLNAKTLLSSSNTATPKTQSTEDMGKETTKYGITPYNTTPENAAYLKAFALQNAEKIAVSCFMEIKDKYPAANYPSAYVIPFLDRFGKRCLYVVVDYNIISSYSKGFVVYVDDNKFSEASEIIDFYKEKSEKADKKQQFALSNEYLGIIKFYHILAVHAYDGLLGKNGYGLYVPPEIFEKYKY